MMNYEIFKEVVTEKFMDYLNDKALKKRTPKVMRTYKVNQVMDGLSLVDESCKTGVSPTVYINLMYDEYKESGDLETVLRKAAAAYEDAAKNAPAYADLDLSVARENIVFQLVNTEQNKDMLSDVPHREFLDLSIIYRWIIGDEGNSRASTIVRNGVAEHLGLTEDELFELASENTRRICKPSIKSMIDVLRGFELPMDDVPFEEIPADAMMWVISNNKAYLGASSMLYEDMLYSFAENIESNFYILPSSIHEVIAVPASHFEPEGLSDMVREVNLGEVPAEEILSYSVYYYDREERKLSVAYNGCQQASDTSCATGI